MYINSKLEYNGKIDMNKRKTLKDYSLEQINKTLYHNKLFEELWKNRKHGLEQLFDIYSDKVLPKKFHIPLLWIPIIECLMKELIKTDPSICFTQIREKFGELEIYTKPSRPEYAELIIGAKTAINIITLIQLRLFNTMKD